MKSLLLVSLIFFASCGGGGGGGSGSSSKLDDVTHIEDTYTGLWGKCEVQTDNTSILLVYSISSKSVVSTYIFYSGLNCQSANLEYEEKFVNDVSKSGGNYNSTLVGASTSSLSAGDITYNNSNNYCGYNDWVMYVPKDILSRNCGGNSNTAGETGTFTLSQNAANIVLTGNSGPQELERLSSPNFNHPGDAITNGSYSFYNEGIAFLFNFNNGSYTVTAYDTVSRVYYSESGTYAINQNIIEFTLGSETPNCGSAVGSSFSLYYSPSLFAVFFKNDKNQILTAESITWPEAQFRSAYVGAGFSQGCL